jgi:hypothetical protein
MSVLEANWPAIRSALVRTVELAASFGLNGQTLRADSALLPIAYYLYRRKAPDNYVSHTQYAADRAVIRDWLIRSLLKASGIWGSGLDTLLTALREAVQQSDLQSFPVDALRHVMTQRGKSLTFEAAEIEDMLHMEYGDRRMFALLSLLFPFVDLHNNFHMDHVFPISRFGTAKLRKAGFDDEQVAALARRANQLPNLQLLEGPDNVEKRATPPAEWLMRYKPDDLGRADYLDRHLLGSLPEDLAGFDQFHETRKQRLRERLTDLLDVRPPLAAPVVEQ